MNLYHGDCLEILPTFPPASVEAIITDLPYGTTACEWDEVIPLGEMWQEVKRVLKPNGAFITTASQPFTTVLIASNLAWFKHEWIWSKSQVSNFQLAKIQPLKEHENIVVFCSGKVLYNPQGLSKDTKKALARRGSKGFSTQRLNHHKGMVDIDTQEFTNYPKSILEFFNNRTNLHHATQKPVSLYEYLVRTYTNAGETVLDICMGSGTTGVAAVQTGRNFIGIEKEQRYFEIASRRIAQAPQPLFTEPPRQPTQPAPDAGESAPLQADFFTPADSTSQASSTPTQRR